MTLYKGYRVIRIPNSEFKSRYFERVGYNPTSRINCVDNVSKVLYNIIL